MEHVRCAEHTLNLAIMDGVKEINTSRVISNIRNKCKELRNGGPNEYLKEKTGLVALIDQETRWGSISAMLTRFVELKPHIQSLARLIDKLKMTEFQWNEVEELSNLLKKPLEITKKLQYEGLTAGYFYRKWTGLKLFLNDNGSLFAKDMVKSMEKREGLLLSPTLLAAVLVDCRHAELLSRDQSETAKTKVKALAMKITELSVGEGAETREEMGESEEDASTESDEEIRALRGAKVQAEQPTPAVSRPRPYLDTDSEEEEPAGGSLEREDRPPVASLEQVREGVS